MTTQLMGDHLIESAPRLRRGANALLTSSAIHAGLIAMAVSATIPRDRAIPDSSQERVRIVDIAQFAPAAAPPATVVEAATKTPKPGFKILAVPAEIPTAIPGVDVAQQATRAEDFTGRGLLGGAAAGVHVAPLAMAGGVAEPIDGEIADQPPYLLPGQMGPAYPDPLRKNAPDGIVVVRFVIDTLGRVEAPTLKVVESTHPLFVASVRAALDRLTFLPAHFSGQRVRVRMEQRFEFHLAAR